MKAEQSLTPNQRAWRRFRQHRLAFACLVMLAGFLLLVVVGPELSRFGSNEMSEEQFQPPSWNHWMGTDVHGRDLFVRILSGARISLLVGFVGAAVSLVIGVSWGATAGYLGGHWDNRMMRVVDILYALPSIIFVIVLITTVEELFKRWASGVFSGAMGGQIRMSFLFAGLGAISWLTMARIVRGQVLSLRKRPFIEAAQALGAGTGRILWRHILPNISGVVIVYVCLTIPSIILYESFLSFLGLGIQPPMASWGSLIAEGAAQLNPISIYWWLVVFPTVTLVTTLLALNFVGDGLRDALQES